MTLPVRPGDTLIRLRRDGQRPLRFAGRLIAEHDGSLPDTFLWHNLALYQVCAGGYAIEIVARRAQQVAVAPPPCCHADLVINLDDALSRFEHHDPARDVCPGMSAPNVRLDDPCLSPAALLIQAAALHGLRQDVVRRYRIGVGLFLARLGRQAL